MEWLKAFLIAVVGVVFFHFGLIFPAGMVVGWLLFWIVANLRYIFKV